MNTCGNRQKKARFQAGRRKSGASGASGAGAA
jgi:predicted RNA-binding Zn ribbon-like protein